MDLDKMFDDVNKTYGSNDKQESDWLKIKEGRNKVRVLSGLEPIPSHFKYGYCLGEKDCTFRNEDGEHPRPSVKFTTWVWSYDEKAIRLANFAWKIAESLRTLSHDPDYAFTEFPMPYDVTITATGAGTKEVEYGVTPARANSDVPPEALKALEKKKSPADVREAMKKKKMKELGIAEKEAPVVVGAIEYPKEDINPEDIPF